MASAENSRLGLAKQVDKDTLNVTDGSFKYLLYSESAIAPQSNILPLDPEVGGGAMLRDVKKVGISSGGGLAFVPRPDTIGMFLHGALGKSAAPVAAATSVVAKKHVFTFDTDQFSLPYYTVRSSPGNLFGETMKSMRVAALSFNWRAANFVRASAALVGLRPAPASTSTWGTTVDAGPQFITSEEKIQIPTGTDIKVLSGAFNIINNMPLDEQWIVGSMDPDDLDVVSRAITLSLAVKITDGVLYNKMMYDPAGGSAWAADMFKEADIKLVFNSDVNADDTVLKIPYSLTFEANGSSGAAANVVWSAEPIAVRAGKTVVMGMTGVFLADAAPVSVELVNLNAVQY